MLGKQPGKKKDWLDSLDTGADDGTEKPVPETKQAQKPAKKPVSRPPTGPKPTVADTGLTRLASAIEKQGDAILAAVETGRVQNEALLRAITSTGGGGPTKPSKDATPSADAIRRRFVTMAWEQDKTGIAYDAHTGEGISNIINRTIMAMDDVVKKPDRDEVTPDNSKKMTGAFQEKRKSRKKGRKKKDE